MRELSLFKRTPTEIAPGAWLVPDWLNSEQQSQLVADANAWLSPPAGGEKVRLRGGKYMSVTTVRVGAHGLTTGYDALAKDGDKEAVNFFPKSMADMARDAVTETLGKDEADRFNPDFLIVNHYDENAKLGMHQDIDSAGDTPIVSLSLGDTAKFRFGNTETRTKPYQDVELKSGDLFVFGFESRFAFHGVPKVWIGSGPPELGVSGRLNITIRDSGTATSGGEGSKDS